MDRPVRERGNRPTGRGSVPTWWRRSKGFVDGQARMPSKEDGLGPKWSDKLSERQDWTAQCVGEDTVQGGWLDAHVELPSKTIGPVGR